MKALVGRRSSRHLARVEYVEKETRENVFQNVNNVVRFHQPPHGIDLVSQGCYSHIGYSKIRRLDTIRMDKTHIDVHG